MFEIKQAKRMRDKIRIGLAGASGSGKTYSALLLARGMASGWNKVALVDSENSGSVYSDLGDYNIGKIDPPFTADKYIEAISACERAGMEVVVIDSMTHEWEGMGGYIERSEKLGQAKYKGNSWAAKSETKPEHQKLIYAIIHSSCHVIATVRSKTETVYENNKVREVGTKVIQDENLKYEFSVFFEIDRDSHLAVVSKDRTRLFEGKDVFVITEETGKMIKEWAESGEKDSSKEVRAAKRIRMGELLATFGKTEEWYLARIGKTFVDITETFLDQIIADLEKKVAEKEREKAELERQRREEGRASEEEERAMEKKPIGAGDKQMINAVFSVVDAVANSPAGQDILKKDPLQKFSDELDEERAVAKKKVAKKRTARVARNVGQRVSA